MIVTTSTNWGRIPPQETEYVTLPLPNEQIAPSEVEGFLGHVRHWIEQYNLNLRIRMELPEADGLLTRPHFVGGPVVNVRVEVRNDQSAAAQTLIQEIARAEF